MAVKRPILTDEQVDELRRRFDVPVKSVIARTPEQRLAKSEKARTARHVRQGRPNPLLIWM